MRYVDNARKAVLNTARTTVKAGYAIKNMPKDTRVQVRNIKKNAKRTAEAAKKTAETVKKVLTSNAFWIILLAAAIILIIVLLISGVVTLICSVVSSMFAWMCPDGDSSDEAISNNISTYISKIQQCESDIQA